MDTNQFIDSKGGASEMARKLSELSGKVITRQRVWMWKINGIPANWILDYPKFFKGYRRN